MTYEESQKIAKADEAAREATRPVLRELEERNFHLRETEMREYRLGGISCKASVNPVNCTVFAPFLQDSPHRVPSGVWMALAEVVAMFEGWKAGAIEHLPPSGEWLEAKVWLAEQQTAKGPR